jgi:Ca-activated chloride channel family protein
MVYLIKLLITRGEKMKKIILGLLLLVICFCFIGCNKNYADGANIVRLSEQDANDTLASWMTRIDVKYNEAPIDLDTQTNFVEELPEINAAFGLTVIGKNQVNIEIWASTEKSGEGNDGWINRVAENFNRSNMKLADGKTVSVSIRAIDAGAQVDYITKGNIKPDAISPANYLWGDMIASKGVFIELVEPRLAGNTAGILMKKSVYDDFIGKHSKITLDGLLDAAIAREIVLGFTNPYTSDTALNMLTQILMVLDPENPLSNKAETKFLEFQRYAPPPAYTTAQMRESAKQGSIDVMTMECQAYSNEPSLREYVFTPFGVRHDNPVFVFDNISDKNREVLNMFIAFAKSNDSQKLAAQMGFNQHDDYKGTTSLSGTDLYNAQALWKKNKSGGRPTVAVFVTDISGSMAGVRLNNLKDSLLNSMQYIGEDNEIGLVSFNDNISVELPIDKFNGVHRAKFQGAVKGLMSGGNTHMYSGVITALNMIKQHKELGIASNYMIFVLTDGETNGGVSEKICAQLIVSYGIPVHTIGYGGDINVDALKRLSSYAEGFSINVSTDNVVYNMKNMFNSQM